MYLTDKELKTYAENGLRTMADWLSGGRRVEANSTPRATVHSRGKDFELFTRDQTAPVRREDRA